MSSPWLLLQVAASLPAFDLLRAAQCCSFWRQVAQDEDLWRELSHRDYPSSAGRFLEDSSSWQAGYAERSTSCFDDISLEFNDQRIMRTLHVGNAGVGKTTYLHCFTEDEGWSKEPIATTLHPFFQAKTVMCAGTVVQLQMWDTAGQERFRTVARSYYRGTHCIQLMYDCTDRRSFEDCTFWRSEIQKHALEHCVVSLVGCKADLEVKSLVMIGWGAGCFKGTLAGSSPS